MEILYALLLTATSLSSLMFCFWTFKKFRRWENDFISDFLVVKHLLQDISDDFKVNQTKLDEVINARKPSGDSQLDNLRKAFSKPVKVHERSGTE